MGGFALEAIADLSTLTREPLRNTPRVHLQTGGWIELAAASFAALAAGSGDDVAQHPIRGRLRDSITPVSPGKRVIRCVQSANGSVGDERRPRGMFGADFVEFIGNVVVAAQDE